MYRPTISVLNFSTLISDAEAQEVIRVVNRQVNEDFAPIWGISRDMKLHASEFDPKNSASLTEEPVKGDSVMYLVNKGTLAGALGYHDLNGWGVPVGFVFLSDGDGNLNPGWTTTLSHEVLELIADPTANVLVPGPDPRDPENMVLHAYESCDAVERFSYNIDGIDVSNFVTPSYFSETDEPGTRNDFLGLGVKSFDALMDCHLAFYDLATSKWVTTWGSQIAVSTVRDDNEHLVSDEGIGTDKPARNDDGIAAALDAYKNHPNELVASYRSEKPGQVQYLRGLTRRSRYQKSLSRLSKKPVSGMMEGIQQSEASLKSSKSKK
jgi:hypothetical protein